MIGDCGGGSAGSAGSAILIMDAGSTNTLFVERRSCATRRLRRACENDWSETTLSRGARRVLVVCDARRLTFGQRMRGIRWARDLAHRIGYESSINGVSGLVASYAVVDTDDDVDRTAKAVAKWLPLGRQHEHRVVGLARQLAEVPLDGPTRLLPVGGDDLLTVLLGDLASDVRG